MADEAPKRVPRVVVAKRKVEIKQGDLMGAMEAAEALGVKQSNLRELSGLPKPFQVLGMGSVWLRQDVMAYKVWRRENPPKPGPKPKQASAAAA